MSTIPIITRNIDSKFINIYSIPNTFSHKMQQNCNNIIIKNSIFKFILFWISVTQINIYKINIHGKIKVKNNIDKS